MNSLVKFDAANEAAEELYAASPINRGRVTKAGATLVYEDIASQAARDSYA